jgi:hypothetical protein
VAFLAGLLLVGVVSLVPGASGVPVQAAPPRLDEGENRQCPAGKPYYVTGLVQHRKRGSQDASPSVRFHTRLANETVQPNVVIDEALTGTNGRFKLCFGDGDVPAGGATRAVRAFSVYTPQTAPVIEVRRIDSASTDFVALYHSDYKDAPFFRQNLDIGSIRLTFNSDEETGFRIKDDFQAGYDRVSGATGRVEAWFPATTFTDSFFCNIPGCATGRIYLIVPDGINSPFIVLHEMGHSVMFYRYNEAWPAPGCTPPHGFGLQNSQAFVWTEDWASFWAMAIRDNPWTGFPYLLNLDLPPPLGPPPDCRVGTTSRDVSPGRSGTCTTSTRKPRILASCIRISTWEA